MEALDVEIIGEIAPGLRPITAIEYGRVQVMLFRSHLAEFSEEDLVFAMDNSVHVFGEDTLLMVAPDEASIAITTYSVGMVMMDWGHWNILAVSPPTPENPIQSSLNIGNYEGANPEEQERSSHTIELARHSHFLNNSVNQIDGSGPPRNQFILYYQWLLDTVLSEDPALTTLDIARVVAGLWNRERPSVKAHFIALAEMEVRRHRAQNPYLYPDQARFPTLEPVPPRLSTRPISAEDRHRILHMLDIVWEESSGQLAAEEAAIINEGQPQQAGNVPHFPADYEWEEPNQIIDMSTETSLAQDPDFIMEAEGSMRFLAKQDC